MLVALHKETGAVLWKCAAPEASGAGYASIVVAEAGGIRQYVTFLGKELGLVGVEARTGKFLWSYKRIANPTANAPTPVVLGDHVFTTNGYNIGSALLKLVPDGDGNVEAREVWFLAGKELQNHIGGVVRLGEYVYGGHGFNQGLPFCVELKTGKKMWAADKGIGQGSATVLYADGRLYFRYQDNTMALVEANPSEYRVVSQFRLPPATSTPGWPTPVIHDGRLFVRANDQVLCYDIRR